MNGAVNATLKEIKALDARLKTIEATNSQAASTSAACFSELPPGPKTEYELSQLSTLPDCVKQLQNFEGNPTQYVSWVHSVESILSDYEIVRSKPLYRSIMRSIRHTIFLIAIGPKLKNAYHYIMQINVTSKLWSTSSISCPKEDPKSMSFTPP